MTPTKKILFLSRNIRAIHFLLLTRNFYERITIIKPLEKIGTNSIRCMKWDEQPVDHFTYLLIEEGLF